MAICDRDKERKTRWREKKIERDRGKGLREKRERKEER